MNSSSSQMNLIEKLADEFADRQRRGDRPDVEDYVSRYPDLANEIRDIFPALVMMKQVAPQDDDLRETGNATVASAPPQQLGEYRILRELGRGGMGVVYEAEQESLQRRVALKILPRELASSPNAMERFKREARAAARMHHTNIVPVFEVGLEADFAFYTMQLIRGQSLDSVIDELKRLRRVPTPKPSEFAAQSIAASLVRGSFQLEDLAGSDDQPSLSPSEPIDRCQAAYAETVDEPLRSSSVASLPGKSEISTAESDHRRYHRSVGRIGIQVADALSYAHARGIVHRDIKPSNLILDASGIVWVTDFGLAKVDDDGMTHTGDILGTMRYMSPERFRGYCDVRADIYSLGLTLYELLVLTPAFDSRDRLKLIEMVRQSDPAAPRSLDPRIPRDLETIVLKACDKEPRRRYQSADDMADDLQRFVNDEPIQARRVSAVERFSRWSRRNKSLATAISALAASLIVIAVGSAFVAWRLQQNLDSRTLTAAFGAFNSGNVRKSQALLKQIDPRDGSAQSIAWRFLNARCLDQQGEEIPIKEGLSSRFAFDPLEEFYATAAGRNEIALVSQKKTTSIRLPADDDRPEVRLTPDTDLTISDNGRWLIAPGEWGDNAGTVLIWELIRTDGEIESTYISSSLPHNAPVTSADIDAAAQRVVSIDSEGNLKLWSLDNPRKELALGSTKSRFRLRVRFSNDGKWIFTHGNLAFGDVTIYSGDDLREVGTVPYGERLAAVKRSPVSQTFAVSGFAGTEIWEIHDGQPRRVHRLGWRRSEDCAYSKDGIYLAVTNPDDDSVRVFASASGQLVARYQCMGLHRNSRTALQDERLFCTPGRSLHQFDFARQLQFSANTQKWWFAPFSLAKTHVAFPTQDQRVRIWNIATDESRFIPNLNIPRRIDAVALSADASRIAIVRRTSVTASQVEVWDLVRMAMIGSMESKRTWALRFSPVNRDLLLISSGGATRIWNIATNEAEHLADRMSISAEFSPDGRRLLLGGNPWDAPYVAASMWKIGDSGDAELYRSLSTRGSYSMAFKSDGSGFAILDRSVNKVRLWNQNVERKRSLSLGSPSVMSLDFSPNDKCLVTASPSGEITFVDPEKGQEIGVFRIDRPLRNVRFMDDCDRIVVATMDGSIFQWDY